MRQANGNLNQDDSDKNSSKIDDIIETDVRFQIPDDKWLAIFTKKYNHLNFKMLSMSQIDNETGNCLLEVTGIGLDQFLNDLMEYLKNFHPIVLAKNESMILMNFIMKDPWILNLLVKNYLLLNYPLKIEQGLIFVKLLTQRSKVDRFFHDLESKSIEFEIKKISHYFKQPLLNKLQIQTLKFLNGNGYFEIPRKKSLSILASELDISPSALSERIRRISKKVFQNYLG